MIKERVLDFANKLSMKKRGSKDEITPDNPEYKILAIVLTEEMAEVGLCLEAHKKMCAEEVASLCGKSLKDTEILLWELAVAGGAFINKIDGVDKYWIERWIPVQMEMIANNNDTIADQDLKERQRYVPKLKHNYEEKIAVIGAGPAGLSCAYYLAIEGYKVTVFEKQHALGGMLTFGIPSFRLEKDVVNAEIDILKAIGVTFKTGIEVGKNVSLDDLRGQGFEAFYLAIGAQLGRNLGLKGENADGVTTGVDFLRNVAINQDLKIEGNTIVIGGGNVAIDVARSATWVGASNVELYCLESLEQMPALTEKIEEAMAENITINNSWGPHRILVKNKTVVGIEFKKCISIFDENQKFSPKFNENDTKIVKANNVLISVGQAMDWGKLTAGSKIKLNANMTIKADAITYQTAEPDVFAGGDILTGPKFAIDAIAMGKEGAISIHRFINKGHSLTIGRINRDYISCKKNNLVFDGYDRLPSQKGTHADTIKLNDSYKDLNPTINK